MMAGLPTGTLTFLFTDIAGSSQLWERHPHAMQTALARHDAILRQNVESHGGSIFKTVGDGCHAVFSTAIDALKAALAAQRALNAEVWVQTGLPSGSTDGATALRVRMAIHCGAAELRQQDYFGPVLNRVARIRDAGSGGQVLLSRAAADLVYDQLPPDVTLRDLGQHRLKDLSHPEQIFQLVAPDLPADFPPLRTTAPSTPSATPSPPLLTTKLYIPPPRPSLVARPRLIAQIAAGMRRKLTLLSAPPGFGKTTLLTEWIADCRLQSVATESTISNLQSPQVAWVSLDEGDNDPIRFWTYVIAALNTLPTPESIPSIGQHAMAMLRSPQPPPIEAILTEIINTLAALDQDVVLVLDDYHVIATQPIHQALAFLLDHLPPRAHLLITSRIDPMLPLPRLRARGELIEIRAADLRFTADEAAAFLREAMGLSLSSEDVAALDTRVEGWIAGLQLAALSLHGVADPHQYVASFSGSHHHIVDYLGEEVLGRQPAHIQAFLLQTCILDRMCGPLCDAVLGVGGWGSGDGEKPPTPNPQPLNPNPQDSYSQLLLVKLERANLFVIPLDAERRWYRYHHLLADMLRQRLQREQPTQVALLHRRAAAWFDQSDLIDEAMRHALAAGDDEHAAELVDHAHPSSLLARGEMTTVQRWLDALPDAAVRARPALCLARARVLVRARQMDAAELWLQDAERGLDSTRALPADCESANAAFVLGEASAVRAFLAIFHRDMPRAIELCTGALAHVPEEQVFARASLYLVLGNAYLLLSDWDAASAAYAGARACGRASGNIRAALIATVNQGNIQVRRGELHAGAALYQEAIELAMGPAGRPLPTAHAAYAALSSVLREWNDLDRAAEQIAVAVELAAQSATHSNVPENYSLLARIRYARDDRAGALAAIQQARELIVRHSQPQQLDLLGATEALVRLWDGDLAAAIRWAETHDPHRAYPHEELRAIHEWMHLIYVRVRIAQARTAEALQLVARLMPEAEHEGRTTRLAEMAVLRALALRAEGKTTQALESLQHALTLAQVGGHIRLFLDEGAAMAELLQLALSRGIVPEYGARLLAAFHGMEAREQSTEALPSARSVLSPHPSALLEPLTDREQEVLRLLAAGMSSPEIAQHFVVSINTVKTQIRSIYGKLDVHSRDEAIAKARALRLLP